MIIAVSGKNGSSKTRFAVHKLLYNKWKRGYQIYSNTKLIFKKPLLNIWFAKYKEVKYFTDLEEIFHVKDCVIFIDEAQEIMSARNWETLPQRFRRKMNVHRHHRIDIIGTFPSVGQVDKDFRRLIHKWFNCDRKFQIGKTKSYFGLFIVREKDDDYYCSSNIEAIDIPDKRIPIFTLFKYVYFIHYFSKSYYDSEDDLLITNYRTICTLDQKNQLVYHILPKNPEAQGRVLFKLKYEIYVRYEDAQELKNEIEKLHDKYESK